MPKSPDAFRTISEVADWLGVQAHVLRFWESKFTQIKPIKRAGGRRYYRPSDMLLLGGIKKLLHDDGLTIKGAQKILREQGISHVCDLSQPLDDLTMAVLEGSAEPALAQGREAEPRLAPPTPSAQDESLQDNALDGEIMQDDAAGWDASEIADVQQSLDEADAADEELAAEYAVQTKETEFPAAQDPDRPPHVREKPAARQSAHQDEFDLTPAAAALPENAHDALPDFLRQPLTQGASETTPEPEEADFSTDAEPTETGLSEQTDAGGEKPQAETSEEPMVMPAFSARPRTPAAPEATPAEPKKPRIIALPQLSEAAEIPAFPSALSALARLRSVDDGQARELRPLLARLIRHRASLSSPRKDARKD